MILLLDLGNTNLYIGIHDNEKIIYDYRTDSDHNRSSDMYAYQINNFLKKHSINVQDFEGAIISSVIPSLTDSIVKAVKSTLDCDCIAVGAGIKTGLPIRIDNPTELGADLVCDCVGAIKKYNSPCIICDLGTANKFLVINQKNEFIGCVISPGIKIAGKALSTSAAQLIDISYKAPKNVIGKNSSDSLNSGAIYGTVSLIEGLFNRIENELGCKTTHIITGGNASLVKDYINDCIYDPHLIFDGLYQIYRRNVKWTKELEK